MTFDWQVACYLNHTGFYQTQTSQTLGIALYQTLMHRSILRPCPYAMSCSFS